MTWTSKYQAQFTKPLIRQLVAIIQRDQRAALDFVGGTNVLPNIANYQLAPTATNQFPVVLLTPDRQVFAPDAVGSLYSKTVLYLQIAVSNQDVAVMAELIQDYVRALDAVLNTVPLYDFYAALTLDLPIFPEPIQTTPLATGCMKDLFVANHVYDEVKALKTGFAQSATIEIHVDREEI